MWWLLVHISVQFLFHVPLQAYVYKTHARWLLIHVSVQFLFHVYLQAYVYKTHARWLLIHVSVQFVCFFCSAEICLQDTCTVVTDSCQCAVVVFFVLQRNMFTRHMHGGNWFTSVSLCRHVLFTEYQVTIFDPQLYDRCDLADWGPVLTSSTQNLFSPGQKKHEMQALLDGEVLWL